MVRANLYLSTTLSPGAICSEGKADVHLRADSGTTGWLWFGRAGATLYIECGKRSRHFRIFRLPIRLTSGMGNTFPRSNLRSKSLRL